MTNEEAIEYNKNLREYMRITDTESEFKFLKENYEALDMAIKVLEQIPDLKETYNKGYKDGQKALAFHLELCKEEQEPCEDCISREAVLDKIKEICFSKEQKWVDFRVSQGSNGQRDLIIKFIESLPSVQPKPKYVAVGNVNFDKDELQKIIDKVNPTIMPEIEYRKAHWQNNACSNCGIYNASAYKNWCPNCGAKMLEQQESEDKE